MRLLIEPRGMNKYKGKTLGWLLKKTEYYFNRYIRLRDAGLPCISCGCNHFEHATHFYPVRGNPQLRYDEDNVHGGCINCNKYLDGNQWEYGLRLPMRIGQESFNALLRRKALADMDTNFKWQRFVVVDKLEYYKQRCKDLESL